MRKPRILALRSKSSDCANLFCANLAHVAVFLHACAGFASEGSGVSFLVCFRAKYTVRYAVWRLGLNQGATPSRSRNSRKRIYLQPGAIRSCLSYGKQCASLRRPNKGLCLREATARSEACRLGTAYEVCLRNPRIIAQS